MAISLGILTQHFQTNPFARKPMNPWPVGWRSQYPGASQTTPHQMASSPSKNRGGFHHFRCQKHGQKWSQPRKLEKPSPKIITPKKLGFSCSIDENLWKSMKIRQVTWTSAKGRWIILKRGSKASNFCPTATALGSKSKAHSRPSFDKRLRISVEWPPASWDTLR